MRHADKIFLRLIRSLLCMFNLVLTNGVEDIKISFTVRSTPIAKKWFKELCNNYALFETDRFSNWNFRDTVNELNNLIDLINEYDNLIDKKVSADTTQQDLNYLHKFFEELRGEVTSGTDWFNSAPYNIQQHVEKFNVLIHILESEIRTKNHPTVVVTFKDRPIFKLENEDLNFFTFRWTQGTVYIDYCQVGKTILDVFKDKDGIADGVRPQEYYSADFMVKFGPTVPYIYYLIRKVHLNVWLAFQKFNFKNFNIGMIPVADLSDNIDINKLKTFNRIKAVECIM